LSVLLLATPLAWAERTAPTEVIGAIDTSQYIAAPKQKSQKSTPAPKSSPASAGLTNISSSFQADSPSAAAPAAAMPVAFLYGQPPLAGHASAAPTYSMSQAAAPFIAPAPALQPVPAPAPDLQQPHAYSPDSSTRPRSYGHTLAGYGGYLPGYSRSSSFNAPAPSPSYVPGLLAPEPSPEQPDRAADSPSVFMHSGASSPASLPNPAPSPSAPVLPSYGPAQPSPYGLYSSMLVRSSEVQPPAATLQPTATAPLAASSAAPSPAALPQQPTGPPPSIQAAGYNKAPLAGDLASGPAQAPKGSGQEQGSAESPTPAPEVEPWRSSYHQQGASTQSSPAPSQQPLPTSMTPAAALDNTGLALASASPEAAPKVFLHDTTLARELYISAAVTAAPSPGEHALSELLGAAAAPVAGSALSQPADVTSGYFDVWPAPSQCAGFYSVRSRPAPADAAQAPEGLFNSRMPASRCAFLLCMCRPTV
jgi:hypothetical protein